MQFEFYVLNYDTNKKKVIPYNIFRNINVQEYTEKEVNAIIKQNISFSDIELVRREMFQLKLIGRLRDGSAYWREQ